MSDRTPAQALSDLRDLKREHVQRDIEQVLFRRNDVRLGAVLSDLASYECLEAVHAYFVRKDIEALKQHCFQSSLLTLAGVGHEGGESFEVARALRLALLSDDIGVIRAMARVETPDLLLGSRNPQSPRFFVRMVQLAILDEHSSLQDMLALQARSGRKADRSLCAEGKDFFSLLIKRDKGGLEGYIQSLYAQGRSGWAPGETYVGWPSILQAKLCWFKGIPVQADSHLAPMALLPVRPLAQYRNRYEFLEPGWKPPIQGTLGRLMHWLLKGGQRTQLAEPSAVNRL